MSASYLTLICHAPTEALRRGAFPRPAETLLPLTASPPPLRPRPGSRLLLAPEPRAAGTADLWPVLRQLPREIDTGLRDIDFAHWQGRALSELAQNAPEDLQHWLEDPEAAPHGGESSAALMRRMHDWLAAWPPGRPAIAITHPAVIRAVAAVVLDIPPARLPGLDIAPLARLELSHYGRWKVRLG